MTVKQFFETYPTSIAFIAKELNMERTTLSKKISKGKLTDFELMILSATICKLGIDITEISKTLTND